MNIIFINQYFSTLSTLNKVKKKKRGVYRVYVGPGRERTGAFGCDGC